MLLACLALHGPLPSAHDQGSPWSEGSVGSFQSLIALICCQFENEVDLDPALTADGSIDLLSDGIQHNYYLYKEEKGFTSANRA